ncbi:MAG: undecaprenyldiphospho-muramoylpentapeptide beta-N-acetylglucosaminyltransferase [Lachnospiraceae bacterium]|nr:undecaprenyldiphospho-muramoylpentapeptide beta-N-acetylglucosaminyltransferase [Lachnospiraceae bacterium]MBO7600040.1 undecaprenyldiphospho-muramoylpentapeptide beta-N-acetylglucosaminyltransferase [Lachnospiraceae bacterium]
MSKKIVLTGGGTAGHVTPNLALIPELKKAGYDITYIGSYNGIEKRLIADFNIPYFGVSTGKLRRYLDPKNFSDPFRILKGYMESKKILRKVRPDIIFSKGGFVSVPVVRAASKLKIPCIIHESDITPGLANKLCIPVATKVCCNFPETMQYIPESKSVLTGTPIRTELTEGSRSKAMQLCGFSDDKPVVLIIGGSQGAGSINKIVRSVLPKMLEVYHVIHICGKDKMDNLLLNQPGYKQFEFLKEDLKDVFALSDIVVSRAGANSICELLALRKPNLLIPLPATTSRGDQLLNAASFEKQGFSEVLREEDLDEKSFMNALANLYQNRQSYIDAMNKSDQMQPTLTIMKLIEDFTK